MLIPNGMVSTRKVKMVLEPLLAAEISAQRVSLTRRLDAEVRRYENRTPDDKYLCPIIS